MSLLSQFCSIPFVTERNTSTSQTTREITNTDMSEMSAVDKDLLLGTKYFRAICHSNKISLSFLESHVAAKRLVVLLEFDALRGVALVFDCPIALVRLGALHLYFFACAFLCHKKIPCTMREMQNSLREQNLAIFSLVRFFAK